MTEVGAKVDVTMRDIVMLYELIDKEEKLVATVGGKQLFRGELRVARPSLWWPIGMGYEAGYLYTLKVNITDPVAQPQPRQRVIYSLENE